MRARLAAGFALALASTVLQAVDSPDWPPPPETLGRMRDLQAALNDPARTKTERDAARAELQRLLKSPAGAAKPEETAKRPARAAIDPFPSVVKPMEPVSVEPARRMGPPPPTARVEVTEPSRRPHVDPATGTVLLPQANGVAVDPRTGRLWLETPSGLVDPGTGRLIPR